MSEHRVERTGVGAWTVYGPSLEQPATLPNPNDAQRIAAALNAQPQPQASVERYGDGVLVHWPDGTTAQYVEVGDCVTGKLQPRQQASEEDFERMCEAMDFYAEHEGALYGEQTIAAKDRIRAALAVVKEKELG